MKLAKKSKKIRYVAVFILLVVLSPIIFHVYKNVSSQLKTAEAKQQVESMPYILDPEFFLISFDPANQPRENLELKEDPGQIFVTYYYHYESPLYPHVWLDDVYNISYCCVSFSEEYPKKDYGEASILKDERWGVFWVRTSETSGGRVMGIYGPYRSNFQTVSRERIKVDVNYKTMNQHLSGIRNKVTVFEDTLRVENQDYHGGTYKFESNAYRVRDTIVLLRKEINLHSKVFDDFRTHNVIDTLDVHNLPTGTYKLIVINQMERPTHFMRGIYSVDIN